MRSLQERDAGTPTPCDKCGIPLRYLVIVPRCLHLLCCECVQSMPRPFREVIELEDDNGPSDEAESTGKKRKTPTKGYTVRRESLGYRCPCCNGVVHVRGH